MIDIFACGVFEERDEQCPGEPAYRVTKGPDWLICQDHYPYALVAGWTLEPLGDPAKANQKSGDSWGS